VEPTAFAVDAKQVVGLVSSAEIIDLEPLSLNKMNLAIKFVWPGLNNSHVHPEMYPINLQIPECETPLCVLSLHRVAEKSVNLQAAHLSSLASLKNLRNFSGRLTLEV